jgi:hypothetical protein
VVVYGCETWYLISREEPRPKEFENRVLRGIYELKRDEVRKVHDAELRNFYSSPELIIIIKTRRMSWAGHVGRIGEKRNAY